MVRLPLRDLTCYRKEVCADVLLNTLSLLVCGRLIPVSEEVGREIIDKISQSEVFPEDRTKDEL